jgi:hypothetical protein
VYQAGWLPLMVSVVTTLTRLAIWPLHDPFEPVMVGVVGWLSVTDGLITGLVSELNLFRWRPLALVRATGYAVCAITGDAAR